MSDDELSEALISLYAHDTGNPMRGVRSGVLRERCRRELRRREAIGGGTARRFSGRLLRESFLTEECLADGYGPEDMIEFVVWMAERMDWHFAGWTEIRGL